MLKTPYERVKAARAADRPTGADYIRNLTDDFMEFHGDRRYGDDPAVIGGIGRMGNMPVTVIALERGHNARERVARNFGSPHPEGYRKALPKGFQKSEFVLEHGFIDRIIPRAELKGQLGKILQLHCREDHIC